MSTYLIPLSSKCKVYDRPCLCGRVRYFEQWTTFWGALLELPMGVSEGFYRRRVAAKEDSICLRCFCSIRCIDPETSLESRESEHEKVCEGFIQFGDRPSRAFKLDDGVPTDIIKLDRRTER